MTAMFWLVVIFMAITGNRLVTYTKVRGSAHASDLRQVAAVHRRTRS
jgi:hypothetical protein